MNWRAYILDFWVSVLKRKFNMVAITFFVATYFGLLPEWQSALGIAAFLIAYSTVYYYNDLLDYESDRKQAFMPSEKLLYHGNASRRDYTHLLAWVSVAGVALCFIYSRLLGVIAALAILANHTRTLVRNVSLREFLLSIVELLNFEALWIAMYGTLIPGVALPLFATYSAAYGFIHAAYKLRSGSLLLTLRRWWVMLLGCATIVAAAFSIPLVVASAVHFFGLVLASIIYVSVVGIQAMRYADNVESGMERIARSHDFAISIVTALLVILGAGIVYANLPTTSLPVSAPSEMVILLSKFDVYQHNVLRLASGLLL